MEQLITIQDQTWAEIASKAWQARKMRMLYEKLEQETFDQLKELSNNTPTRGSGFLFNYIERKGPIEYGSIPELKSVDIESYRKSPIIIWKLEKE